MTYEQRNAIIMDRYTKLAGSPKSVKCPGVVRKLRRKLRKAGALD